MEDQTGAVMRDNVKNQRQYILVTNVGTTYSTTLVFNYLGRGVWE